MERGWDASTHLRELLAKHEWTHAKLAEMTGIRQSTISAYATESEESRRDLGIVNANRIATAFGVTTEELGEPVTAEAKALQRVQHRLRLVEKRARRNSDRIERILSALTQHGIALPEGGAAPQSGGPARQAKPDQETAN